MMTERTGADRSAATGVAWSEANHALTSMVAMSLIGRPRNHGRVCLAKQPRLTLRVPGFQFLVVAEDLLEQNVIRCCFNAIPVGCQHRPGPVPGVLHVQGRGIADDLPDPLALVLGMDEEALASCRIETDTEALEITVVDVADGLAWSKRRDARLGKTCRGQRFPPLLELQRQENPPWNRPAVALKRGSRWREFSWLAPKVRALVQHSRGRIGEAPCPGSGALPGASDVRCQSRLS